MELGKPVKIQKLLFEFLKSSKCIGDVHAQLVTSP